MDEPYSTTGSKMKMQKRNLVLRGSFSNTCIWKIRLLPLRDGRGGDGVRLGVGVSGAP